MSKTTNNELPPDADAVPRRAFVGTALGAAGACYAGAIAYPVYRYLASPAERAEAAAAVTEVTLKDAQKLPTGSVLMFKFGPKPAMLIHHADGSWVALSAVCTHLGCTVQYQTERNVIHCACHGGEYDPVTGKNIAGPPPRPLTRYVAKVMESDVVVSRS
ncbi:MAG: Rieske (2Fe-2S) protein [Verrucomicrobiota bacterium]|jgi:cytochrome b6-f complex iron-sulfur subunit